MRRIRRSSLFMIGATRLNQTLAQDRDSMYVLDYACNGCLPHRHKKHSGYLCWRTNMFRPLRLVKMIRRTSRRGLDFSRTYCEQCALLRSTVIHETQHHWFTRLHAESQSSLDSFFHRTDSPPSPTPPPTLYRPLTTSFSPQILTASPVTVLTANAQMYVTTAAIGSVAYLMARRRSRDPLQRISAGFFCVVILRFLASSYNIRLPAMV